MSIKKGACTTFWAWHGIIRMAWHGCKANPHTPIQLYKTTMLNGNDCTDGKAYQYVLPCIIDLERTPLAVCFFALQIKYTL